MEVDELRGEGGDHEEGGEHEEEEGQREVKKSRRNSVRKPRTKGLVKKLQEQIEFYFGDSNLSKDRFLHQKIQESQDGYISVDVIADFKKMRSLTIDRSLVMKAIQNSSLVELSDNGSSLRRCRPLPTVSQAEVDSRTVYVEKFPAQVLDHEMVSKMFRQFGEVCYVSLPKFKTSGAIKGFAFIEFAAKDAAERAVEYFRVKDALPPDMKKRKPSKVLHALSQDSLEKISEEMETAIGNDDPFLSDEKKLGEKNDEAGINDDDDSVIAGHLEDDSKRDGSVKEVQAQKRDRIVDEEEQNISEGIKKIKGDKDSANHGDKVGKNDSDNGHKDRNALKEIKDTEEELADVASDKSGRKRLRVEKEAQTEENADGAVDEKVPVEKRLKPSVNKDTEEDDLTSEKLKYARKGTEDGDGDAKCGRDVEDDSGEEEGEGSESKHGKGSESGGRKKRHRTHRKKPWGLALRDMDLRVMSKSEWSEMKEMFKNMQKTNFKKLKDMTSKSDQEQNKSKKGFVKDCLVKVELQKECEEQVKDMLKELCEKFGDVAFVDLKEGDTEGYVRYKSSGCVESLMQSESRVEGVCLQSMKEEEEREYYLKSMAERKQQFRVNKKKMNQRGKDKLISKVLRCIPAGTSAPHVTSSTAPTYNPTHIKFSDSDDSALEAE